MGNGADIDAAFEMLVEAVDRELDVIARKGSAAFVTLELDDVESLQRAAAWLQQCRTTVTGLRSEWLERCEEAGHTGAVASPMDSGKDEADGRPERAPAPPPRTPIGPTTRGPRRRGDGSTREPVRAATPCRVYRPYVLQALVDLGGEASRREILVLIRKAMAGVLQPSDLERYATGSRSVIWEAMASTEVKNLKQQGMMARSAPGVWVVTDTGRAWVAANPPELP